MIILLGHANGIFGFDSIGDEIDETDMFANGDCRLYYGLWVMRNALWLMGYTAVVNMRDAAGVGGLKG